MQEVIQIMLHLDAVKLDHVDQHDNRVEKMGCKEFLSDFDSYIGCVTHYL